MIDFLQRTARSIGFDVRRVRSVSAHDPYLLMRRMVSGDKPVVFDVGAHKGQTAKHIRARMPNATIHSFEPFPDSFGELSAAVVGDPMTTAHQVALSDTPGVARLKVNVGSATNSLLATDSTGANYWPAGLFKTQREVEVPTKTIDSFCLEHNIRHIDILKLDVQGFEYSVLTGAKEMLSRQAIDMVFMEMIMAPAYVGQRKLHEYLSMFDSHGYSLVDLYSPMYRNGRLLQADALVVSGPVLERFERASIA